MRPCFRAPILLMTAALAGCALLRPPAQEPRVPAARAVSLRAEAVITLKKAVPISGRGVIVAQSPDKFRIEAKGPFGSTAALMVSDGETLSVFSGEEVKVYRWDDPSLPYPFRAGEVVSFLLGGSPPASAGEKAGDGGVTRDEEGRITRFVKPGDGPGALTVEISGYRVVSGAEVPSSISIKNRKIDLNIRYTSIEVNPEVSPQAFVTEPPNDMEVPEKKEKK